MKTIILVSEPGVKPFAYKSLRAACRNEPINIHAVKAKPFPIKYEGKTIEKLIVHK